MLLSLSSSEKSGSASRRFWPTVLSMAKRKGRPRVEYVTPIVHLTSVTMHVSVRIEDRHSRMAPGGDKWLEVRGTMDQPVQGISEIQLSVHEHTDDIRERERGNSVGGVIQVRPYVSGARVCSTTVVRSALGNGGRRSPFVPVDQHHEAERKARGRGEHLLHKPAD